MITSSAGDESNAIVTRGLTKYYGDQCVVNSLDLRVPRGCVYGFLGRNGAGKSTTIKMLMGMVQPDLGSAEPLGHDVRKAPPELRQRIAYIAENHPLCSWMTVGEAARFTASFYPRWNERLLTQILDHFELPRRAKLRRLSNGQRAQASLAFGPGMLVVAVVSAALAEWAYSSERAQRQPRAAWLAALVFLLGVPGFLAYLATRRWGIVRVAGQVCHRIGRCVGAAGRSERGRG